MGASTLLSAPVLSSRRRTGDWRQTDTEKMHRCCICGAEFEKRGGLGQHMKTHSVEARAHYVNRQMETLNQNK